MARFLWPHPHQHVTNLLRDKQPALVEWDESPIVPVPNRLNLKKSAVGPLCP